MLDFRQPALVTSKMTMSDISNGHDQLITVFIDYYISYFRVLRCENRELLGRRRNHNFVAKAARECIYYRIFQHRHYGFNL